jgi:hypothetical protein
VEAGVKLAGIFRWRWCQLGWDFLIELVWNIRLELESNRLEYLDGGGVK